MTVTVGTTSVGRTVEVDSGVTVGTTVGSTVTIGCTVGIIVGLGSIVTVGIIVSVGSIVGSMSHFLFLFFNLSSRSLSCSSVK